MGYKKALSKHRLEKADDDLLCAESLLKDNFYTQSLNRSYYSIFHATRALLALEGIESRKHSGILLPWVPIG